MCVRSCCVSYWSGNEEMQALHAVWPKSNPKTPIPATCNPTIFLDGYLFFLLDFGLEECCEQCTSGSSLMK